MEFIILFMIIFSLSMSVRNLLDKRIEETIPIAVIFMILVIYIAGLLDQLNLGVLMVEILSVISIVYNGIYLLGKIKKKECKQELEKIFTPGLFIYMALFMVFIIMNSHRILADYDEFNHWGLMVKNMFTYNGYGTVENSHVSFNEYPPFTACFQYMLLTLKGEYVEDLIIIAQNILYLSIMIPITKQVQVKKKCKNLIFMVWIIITTPMIFYEDFFCNILVDGLLGILFAIGLWLISKEDENKIYRKVMLSCMITALALTKTTGIVFAIVLMVMEVIKQVKMKEKIKTTLIVLILPIILTSAWYMKINFAKSGTEWNFNNVVQMNQNKDVQKISQEYMKAFYEKEEITVRHLTPLHSILLLIAYSIYLYQDRKDKNEKKNYQYIMIGHAICSILFLIGLLWMYVTIFMEHEAITLACYGRYVSTMLLSWLMLNHIVLCNKEKNKINVWYMLIVVTIIFMPKEVIKEKYIHKEEYIQELIEQKAEYTAMSRFQTIFLPTDKIFYVSDVFTPFVLTLNQYEFMEMDIANHEARVTGTKEQFEHTLMEENYTYVYVYKVEGSFRNKYRTLFEHEVIQDDMLYQVCLDQYNKVQLKKVI